MKSSALTASLSAVLCAILATPALAAQSAVTSPTVDTKTPQIAEACLIDLSSFGDTMQKDGFWLGGSGGSGYGYPIGGYGYGHPVIGNPGPGLSRYQNARPGYEVRTLVAAANILAQRGEQQACDDVLATTRTVYKSYLANMQDSGALGADTPNWQQQQIASAKSVTGPDTSFRSDQLLGTDVRNLQNATLGSVDDIVMSPQTGKIAYLVIARGGVFGIGQKYVPVPWADFKATPSVSLMVLDTTKADMDAAPQVDNRVFATSAGFGQESAKVDAYWQAHQMTATPPTGNK